MAVVLYGDTQQLLPGKDNLDSGFVRCNDKSQELELVSAVIVPAQREIVVV